MPLYADTRFLRRFPAKRPHSHTPTRPNVHTRKPNESPGGAYLKGKLHAQRTASGMPDPIGEVIESSTRTFVAEVYDEVRSRPDEPAEPAFGEWVWAETARGDEVYALVSHVEIGSYDANRQAVALGMDEEERRREMPMVQELLRMTVRAQILAFRSARSGSMRQTLPPHPPDIHAFVHRCTREQVRDLDAPYDFLRTLVESPDPAVPVDDLLVAALRQVHEAHGAEHGGRPELVAAGRTLSRLLDDDHERLQSILRRVL